MIQVFEVDATKRNADGSVDAKRPDGAIFTRFTAREVSVVMRALGRKE